MKKALMLMLIFGLGSLIAAEAPAIYKKCTVCHGIDGKKVAPGTKGKITIAGLPKAQIITDLKGYKAKTMSKGGAAAIMQAQAANLSDADIESLAEYISNLPK